MTLTLTCGSNERRHPSDLVIENGGAQKRSVRPSGLGFPPVVTSRSFMARASHKSNVERRCSFLTMASGAFSRSRAVLARYDVSPHMVKWWKGYKPDDGQVRCSLAIIVASQHSFLRGKRRSARPSSVIGCLLHCRGAPMLLLLSYGSVVFFRYRSPVISLHSFRSPWVLG